MVEYKNRYNEIYKFSKVDDGVMWEGNFRYCRMMFPTAESNSPNKVDMVDPSGGPYLEVGMDLGSQIDPKFKDMIIKDFQSMPTGFKIIIE